MREGRREFRGKYHPSQDKAEDGGLSAIKSVSGRCFPPKGVVIKIEQV